MTPFCHLPCLSFIDSGYWCHGSIQWYARAYVSPWCSARIAHVDCCASCTHRSCARATIRADCRSIDRRSPTMKAFCCILVSYPTHDQSCLANRLISGTSYHRVIWNNIFVSAYRQSQRRSTLTMAMFCAMFMQLVQKHWNRRQW